jgi:hypothetical protein
MSSVLGFITPFGGGLGASVEGGVGEPAVAPGEA